MIFKRLITWATELNLSPTAEETNLNLEQTSQFNQIIINDKTNLNESSQNMTKK